MKINRIFKIITLLALIIGCGQKNKDSKGGENQKELNKLESNKNIANTVDEPIIKDSEIAKFTIASIMNQKPENISVKEENSILFVSYKLYDSKKTYKYKIKIIEKNIVWGNADGRWRDTQYDEKISYETNSGKVTIIQTFEDGSKINNEFNILD